jgi:Cutinase
LIWKIGKVLLSILGIVVVGTLLVVTLTGIGVPSSFHAQLSGEESAQDPYGSYSPGPGSSCPPLKFFGVRGSGETAKQGDGYGTTVQQFEQTLHALVPGLSAEPINYLAVPVGYDLQYYTQVYNSSVLEGENILEDDLLVFWHECPSTDVVLAGYSQGAQVAGDVADALSPAQQAKIAAVALFGDPRFNGGQPRVDVANTGYSPHRGGIIVHWPGQHSSLRQVPSDLVPKFHSYCIENDPICNWTPQWLYICFYATLPVYDRVLGCPHLQYVTEAWPFSAAFWAYASWKRS